jgi:hypothetical protein
MMASRLRCAWRSLIVWVPLTLLYGTGAWLGNHGHFAIGSALGARRRGASTPVSSRTRSRIPPAASRDRVAGTRLVPR